MNKKEMIAYLAQRFLLLVDRDITWKIVVDLRKMSNANVEKIPLATRAQGP